MDVSGCLTEYSVVFVVLFRRSHRLSITTRIQPQTFRNPRSVGPFYWFAQTWRNRMYLVGQIVLDVDLESTVLKYFVWVVCTLRGGWVGTVLQEEKQNNFSIFYRNNQLLIIVNKCGENKIFDTIFKHFIIAVSAKFFPQQNFSVTTTHSIECLLTSVCLQPTSD